MADEVGSARVRVLGAAVLLVLLLPVQALAADPASELQEAERERDQALSERGAALQRLDELTMQITAGADELGRLGGELRNLDVNVAGAQVAEDAARRRSAAAEQRVAEAEARLAQVQGVLDERSRALAARAVQLYMRGAARQQDLLGGFHAESTAFLDRLPYLEALARSDAALVETTEAVEAVARAARDALAELRDDAAEQEALAQEATMAVENLRERQGRVLEAARAVQDERADLLAALEQDAQAREELVLRLEALAERVSAELAGQGGVDPIWMVRLPPHGQEWGPSMARAAGAQAIDPRLLAALVWTESNFHAEAISPVGAIGLCQLMPATASSVGVDPYQPEENLDGGARYLGQLLGRYPGRPDLAVAAYNAGPGRVQQAVPAIPETQLYVSRVLGRYEELSG